MKTTDLKNRTGSSIYCWENETNGGHIDVTTWGVQWRHRKENEKTFPLHFCDATEISNMAAVGHSNMAAVGNNKNILWNPQNSLVIFTFKIVEGNILAAF